MEKMQHFYGLDLVFNMKALIILLFLVMNSNLHQEKQFHTEIAELGGGNYLPYLVVLKKGNNEFGVLDKIQCAKLLETPSVVIKEEETRFKIFRDSSDLATYTSHFINGKLQSRHVFYNLNKYGVDLVPDRKEKIITPFLADIKCELKSVVDQIKCVIQYSEKTANPILFYRKYIAEFTLLVYLYYLEKLPSFKYIIKLEDETYIPYLQAKGSDFFVLGSLFDDLFTNNDSDNIISTIEFGLAKLNRVVNGKFP